MCGCGHPSLGMGRSRQGLGRRPGAGELRLGSQPSQAGVNWIETSDRVGGFCPLRWPVSLPPTPGILPKSWVQED